MDTINDPQGTQIQFRNLPNSGLLVQPIWLTQNCKLPIETAAWQCGLPDAPAGPALSILRYSLREQKQPIRGLIGMQLSAIAFKLLCESGR